MTKESYEEMPLIEASDSTGLEKKLKAHNVTGRNAPIPMMG